MTKKILKKIYKRLFDLRNLLLGIIFSVFPINKNKIIVSNFWGRGYSDNPKYVIDYLINNYKGKKIIWLLKKGEDKRNIPSEIEITKYGSVKSIYDYTTSKIWIDNSRKEHYLFKRKKQYYIQLWHGGVGMKKIEAAAIDTLDEDYIRNAKRDSKMIDYAISNSDYRTNIYKYHFWYNGAIKEFGSPRNDIFFGQKKENISKELKEKYNISENSFVLLYIPTFRKNKNYNYVDFDIEKLISKLEKKYNKKVYFIIKLHPNVKKIFDFKNKYIITIPSEQDVEEIMLIADTIISDYSSVIFDFLYTNKPIFLYAPDFNEYIKERGTTFEYKDLPFSKAYESKELIKNIENEDYVNYKQKLENFLEELKLYDDGNASQRVVELICSLMKE